MSQFYLQIYLIFKNIRGEILAPPEDNRQASLDFSVGRISPYMHVTSEQVVQYRLFVKYQLRNTSHCSFTMSPASIPETDTKHEGFRNQEDINTGRLFSFGGKITPHGVTQRNNYFTQKILSCSECENLRPEETTLII